MNTLHPNKEKLSYLGAALITALGAHVFLSAAAIAGFIAPTSGSIVDLLWTALGALWNVLGIAAGLFVGHQSIALITAQDYRKASIAAIGALLLPLTGTAGAVTAFALIPLGVLCYALLKRPEWQSAFADATYSDDSIVTADFTHDEAVQEAA